MQSKLLNRRDLEFVLYELLDVEALTQRPRFAEHSRETFDAALETAARIAEEKFAPHNRKADLNEPRFNGGKVEMIPEVGEALEAFRKAGFMSASQDFELGGMTALDRCAGLFRLVQCGQCFDRRLSLSHHRQCQPDPCLWDGAAEAALPAVPA